MDSNNDTLHSQRHLIARAARVALAAALLAPIFLLTGCMTPEDRAFYGRGWINPDELDQDQDQPPPAQSTDPTDVRAPPDGPGILLTD